MSGVDVIRRPPILRPASGAESSISAAPSQNGLYVPLSREAKVRRILKFALSPFLLAQLDGDRLDELTRHDHVFGRCMELLKMRRLDVRLEGGLIGVHLEEPESRRIFLLRDCIDGQDARF